VTLFLPLRNERLERAEGRVLSADDAELVKKLTGADEVKPTPVMGGIDWPGSIGRIAAIYTPFEPAEGQGQSRGELRAVKSPREIALIRRASEPAGYGVMEAMRSTEPGVYEYQLDAAARYENFTDFLPTELSEIEKLVRERGVVQKTAPQPEAERRGRR
jgi:Xaa-Pro aminopeptidase